MMFGLATTIGGWLLRKSGLWKLALGAGAAAGILAGGWWIMTTLESRAARIDALEAERGVLTQRLVQSEERRVREVQAVEAELERQTAQTKRYRAARESLADLEDGPVAPVLRGALEAIR